MPRRTPPPSPHSSELFALLNAAKDNPDDDTPRLVLADWLDERNHPGDDARAELIRLQCELRGLLDGDRRRKRLDARCRKLQVENEAAWLGEARGLIEGVGFERGLIQFQTPPKHLFSRTLTKWLASESGAWVEGLSVYRLSALGVKRLAAHPILTELTALGVYDLEGPDGLDKLFAAPAIGRVRNLGLSGKIGAGGVARLVKCPYLARLHHLGLGAAGLGPNEVRVLAGWPGLARLTELNLSGNDVADAGAEALAASPHVAGLVALRLVANEITLAGARAIASSPNLGRLRHLELGNNYLLDAGVEAIARSSNVAGLTHLSLWFTAVGSAGAQALADSPHLKGLVDLDLTANGSLPDTPGAAALRRRFGKRVRM